MYDNRMVSKRTRAPLPPLNAWVVSELERTGRSNTDLARFLGIEQPRIAEIKSGARKVQAHEIEKIAAFFGSRPPLRLDDVQSVTPLVGYVGAGAEAHYYANGDNPNEFVPRPPGASDTTVAVEVRGDSLGSIFNRWLVFYDSVRTPPTEDMLRQLCVVGLADGRVLVKQLVRGSTPGRWHLISQTQGVIEDVEIQWAALVRAMTPK